MPRGAPAAPAGRARRHGMVGEQRFHVGASGSGEEGDLSEEQLQRSMGQRGNKRHSTYSGVTPPGTAAPIGELGLGRTSALGGVAGPFRSSSKRRGTALRVRAAAQQAVSGLEEDAKRLREAKRRRALGLPE